MKPGERANSAKGQSFILLNLPTAKRGQDVPRKVTVTDPVYLQEEKARSLIEENVFNSLLFINEDL